MADETIRMMRTTRYAWRLGSTKVKWNVGAGTFWVTFGDDTETSTGHAVDMDELQNLIVLLESLAKQAEGTPPVFGNHSGIHLP